MDHSEDSENGKFFCFTILWGNTGRSAEGLPAKEIEKLRQEAQALKKIREMMGTESFPRLLFDKVYKDDIIRLRSMEEMWKTRRPPEAMDYGSIIGEADNTAAAKDAVLNNGQRIWNLHENAIVFRDRYEFA